MPTIESVSASRPNAAISVDMKCGRASDRAMCCDIVLTRAIGCAGSNLRLRQKRSRCTFGLIAKN